MKRLFLRIGVLAAAVVLGLIAFAYAQRNTDDRYTANNSLAENVSPLRGGNAQQTDQKSAANPLRENTLRPGPANYNSSNRNIVVDSRVRKVADEIPAAESSARTATDPFGLNAHKSGTPTDAGAPQTLPSDSIPDAAALDPPNTNNQTDSSRYPQLVGPNLNGPSNNSAGMKRLDAETNPIRSLSRQNSTGAPLVERYVAGGSTTDRSSTAGNTANHYADAGKSAARYGNRSAGATTPASNTQEPAPFKADPFSAPTALSSSGDKARDRVAGISGGNSSAEGFSNNDGTGQPGAKQLEGAQSPQVTIQKFVPNEIQVGKSAKFKVVVRNTGSIPACQVEICDQVPRGTKMLGTTPRATQGPRGEVVWTIGTLRPGEESSVEMELMPTAEGEIGSVATVHFGADASARTISTRPKLAVEMSASDKVLIGEQVVLSITVSNPGTGVATGVVLEERIPPGLQHPAGAELEYEVGDLRPGESKKLDLPLVAITPGQAINVLTARADGNLQTEERLEMQVVSPKLDIASEGPKRRYLEKEAVYQLSLSNPGTAAAQQVELVAYLPPGLKFVSANNAAHYDEANRAVHWRLEELPCNETGEVELVTMPIEAGQHSIKLRGTAQRGLAVEKEQAVLVEGIAALAFHPVDVTGPTEVGGETVYEVQVVNQGSKAASNVRLAVLLPPELQPIAAEGPARHATEGNRIVFEGLARLAPKADANYRIKVKGIRPGDLRTRFQLVSDEMQTPVTKEESTRVYADE